MAHRLSNKRTGTEVDTFEDRELIAAGKQSEAAMFYVKRSDRDLPWHGLGTPVSEAKTAAEALVLSGCNYTVKASPLYDADGHELSSKVGRLMKRTDRFGPSSHLGVVGRKYTEIQNEDGFNILDYIIGDNTALFDTAGAFGNGEKVWASCKLLDNDIKIAGDDIATYFAILLTHDGSGQLEVRPTPIRVVCENTANMAFGVGRKGDNTRVYKIKHLKNYEEKVKEARKLYGFIKNEYYPNFVSVANKLVAAKRTEKQFEEIVQSIIGKYDKDATKRAAGLWERKHDELFTALNVDDLANVKDTAWGHYNAVADWADHSKDLRGDNREANAFLRTFERTPDKDKALELLLADIKLPELVARAK